MPLFFELFWPVVHPYLWCGKKKFTKKIQIKSLKPLGIYLFVFLFQKILWEWVETKSILNQYSDFEKEVHKPIIINTSKNKIVKFLYCMYLCFGTRNVKRK